MLCNFSKCLTTKFKCCIYCARHMTTTEVSTALRPFYFSVHPDLFGQYPNQRTTNENSLKQLSSVIETLQSRRAVKPCSLDFYLRDKSSKQGTFRLVKIYLSERDVRSTVLTVLKSVNLPTSYVESLPPEPKESKQSVKIKIDPKMDISNLNEHDPIFASFIMKKKVKEAKEAFKLRKWLKNNHKDALDRTQKQKPIREEVKKLKQSLYDEWGIAEVRWDCGWNEQHFRGCLQSLKSLTGQYPELMHVLRGRILVFAPCTGVSLDGHIMLNSGEVRHNWLDLIKNVKKHDLVLLRIPGFEKAVSQVLRSIKVVRRKFMPKILAGEYERHLLQIATSLNDYSGTKGYPKEWPKSLNMYELVVESEAGPLMVSPTGQFIVPSTCPGFMLVNFITNNLEVAAKSMAEYKANKHVEVSLHKRCIEELRLASLHKDDNVTPNLMISCCERLLEHKENLSQLRDLHLNITHYYSVMSDGTFCIPWNWIL